MNSFIHNDNIHISIHLHQTFSTWALMTFWALQVCWGVGEMAILCIGGCLEASLTPDRYMLVAPPPPHCDNQEFLQTWPNISWWTVGGVED